MQQLTIGQKNLKKDRRPGKGRALALSRRIYILQNTDNTIYYVESETSDDQYYFCKFKPDVFEWCSCKDNSTRYLKCKHLFAIEFAIKWGTLIDIDKLPKEAKKYGAAAVQQSKSSSYEEDDYSF
jgi:hypothetical protein